jgi:hypothetical protein
VVLYAKDAGNATGTSTAAQMACSRCCKCGGSSLRGPRVPDRQWREQGETEATEGKLRCG